MSPRCAHLLCLGRLAALVGAALLVTACRIERQEVAAPATGSAPPPGGQFANQTFDAKAQVGDIWAAKVLPALQARAGDFAALRTAMKANLDEAGARNGHRERGEGAPWNFVTQLKGRTLSVEGTPSAGKMSVDVDGDGQVDAVVQLGPVIRGTSLRDSLPFISFTAYTNQVEFAQLANAFNDQAYATALKSLPPRADLAGKGVALLGVFTTDDASDVPVILPVQLTLGSP